MNRTFVTGATGFGLIAVCYGLSRYAFGLFLPQIASELALSPAIAGVISGGGVLSYCLAIGASAWLTERMGPRPVAVAAGIAAALGMAGIALAPSAAWLAVGLIVAGASTGLASPPLAAAVSATVPPARQDAVNTIINAGTAAGIALSGPAAMLAGTQWRAAFMGFAGLALLMAVATYRTVRGGTAKQAQAAPVLPAWTPDLARLVAACLLTGAASAVVWTFGADLVTARLNWDAGRAGVLWIAVGCAGIFGAAAGHLIARFGFNAVHAAFQFAMLVSIGLVGCDIGTAPLALAGAGLFGAAYMMLSGAYLVWGVSALPDRPATGVAVAFLMLSVGQALGAAAFGMAMGKVSANAAVLSFAALAAAAAAIRRQAPRLATDGSNASRDKAREREYATRGGEP